MPIATSTHAAMIDTLLGIVRALPECAAPVAVFDGLSTTLPATFVVVAQATGPVTQGTQEWDMLGGHRRKEQYAIRCTIIANGGGGGQDSSDLEQKRSRDVAFTILAAIDRAIIAALSPGGAISAVLNSGWAGVHNIAYTPTVPAGSSHIAFDVLVSSTLPGT